MIKRFIIVGALVALVCGGLVGFNLFRDKMIADFFANMPAKIITVSAKPIELEEWHPTIDTIGSIKAAQGVDLAFETTGVIQSITFTANEMVKAGQVLVQLNDDVETAQIPGAESALATTQTQFDRLVSLKKRGVVAQSDFDSAQQRLNAARSELDRLKAILRMKTVKAPFNGIIGIPHIDLGAYIQPGTIVATLQDLSLMNVDFTVPEQRRSELSLGQVVKFGSSATTLTHEGKIIGIDPKIDPQSRLVSVRAQADNNDATLFPGQFVQVQVALPPQPDTVALAQTAVVSSLYGDYVFILEKTDTVEATASAPTDEKDKPDAPLYKAAQVFVKLGRRSGGIVEITSGLKAGQIVVTAGQNKIQPGSLVTIDNSLDLTTLTRQQ